MSAEYGNEYKLGEEITDVALGKRAKETVVVSVRLTSEEFSRLEKLCEQAGKSMSQLVREAISAYEGLSGQSSGVYSFAMFDSEGAYFSLGGREVTTPACYPITVGLTGFNQLSGRSGHVADEEQKGVEYQHSA